MPKARMQRQTALWAAVIILCLQSLFFAVRSGEIALTSEEEAALATATALSRANIAVAKIIRPAVVNIRAERRVTLRMFNDPSEFFSEMYGLRFPGQSRSPRPQTRTETEIGQGSGVIIDEGGYILTNNHVVGEADAIQVYLLDGREFTAELIGADPSSDVAVIKITADNLTVARMGDSDLVEVGEMVMAVGNPFGLDFTVTSGIVSARGRSGMGVMEIEDFIQTDASINPGNSGGPLVNLKGEVIGVNTFIYTNRPSSSEGGGSIGVGFAIPSNMAKSIMQSLISHKQVTNSYLGVETQPLTQELAQAFGLKSARGALVQAVTKDSPANRAGLRRGDVVVRWGRREINDDRQFRNLVTVTPPDQPVEVEVIREGQAVTLSVTLVQLTPEMVIARGGNDRFLQGLGITVDDLNPAVLAKLGYPPDTVGALVTGVQRRSPADSLGFRVGSIIISVNGKTVNDIQDLHTVLAAAATSRTKNYELVWMTGDFVRRATISVN